MHGEDGDLWWRWQIKKYIFQMFQELLCQVEIFYQFNNFNVTFRIKFYDTPPSTTEKTYVYSRFLFLEFLKT